MKLMFCILILRHLIHLFHFHTSSEIYYDLHLKKPASHTPNNVYPSIPLEMCLWKIMFTINWLAQGHGNIPHVLKSLTQLYCK